MTRVPPILKTLSCLVTCFSQPAVADTPDPCRDKEFWFETGIGYYSEGYTQEELEKKARSIYKTMAENLSEDEAIAIAMGAWSLLSQRDLTELGQLERIALAHSYYLQCLENSQAN